MQSDHSSNIKRGVVCIYNKYFLHLRVLDIKYLHEWINFKLKIGGKLCYIIALYRSPSQSQDDFEKFSENLELSLNSLVQKNSFLVVLITDFNAKLKSWYKNEKRSFEGNIIENITSQFGLQQVIKEATHILDHSSSCINFIFTSQANVLIESVVHPSLHLICHHQIIYSTFDLYDFLPSSLFTWGMALSRCKNRTY